MGNATNHKNKQMKTKQKNEKKKKTKFFAEEMKENGRENPLATHTHTQSNLVLCRRS